MGSSDTNLRRWWLVVVGVVSLVLAGAGAIAYNLISELRTAHERVLYERAEELRNADALGIAVFSRSSNVRGFLLSGDPSPPRRADSSAPSKQRVARCSAARTTSGSR